MFFNEMAMAIERFIPDAVPIMQKAKLFIMDKPPHEHLPKDIPFEEFNNFFMPFPIVAIEDPGTATILIDLVKNQKGLNTPRIFMELQSSRAPDYAFEDGYKLNYRTVSVMSSGYIGEIQQESTTLYSIKGDIEHTIAFDNKTKKLIADDKTMKRRMVEEDLFKETSRQTLKNVVVTLQQIMYLNNLENKFILEEKPVKWTKYKKIARSHQRSKFTILHPKTIRKRMGLTTTGKALKDGYERRRHFRTYRDDRYTKMKGKRVVINATWVGPVKATVGNKIYKVRTDL